MSNQAEGIAKLVVRLNEEAVKEAKTNKRFRDFEKKFEEKNKQKNNQKKQPIHSSPIKWSGTEGQLVYLFEQLRDNDFLSISINVHSTIKKHFVDSTGKPFTNLKQIKQDYLQSKTGKPKRADELEKLVNKAKEQE